MKTVYVETFNNQSFKGNANDSGFIKMKYFNTQNLIFQHTPVKENLAFFKLTE